MNFKLPPLPYTPNALEPHISRRTLEFHHGKHHDAYVKKLNELVDGTPFATMTLEEIVRKSAGRPEARAVFNNAAQAWNHAFFWNSMRAGGGGEPGGELASRVRDAFGSYRDFRQKFVDAAVNHFGSGWAWLVLEADRLAIVSTHDAENPLISDRVALLTCDLWEHAYYLDYQNQRKAFVEAFLDHLVNWEHVAAQLGEAQAGRAAEPARRAAGRR